MKVDGQSEEDRMVRRVGRMSLAKIGARKAGPPSLILSDTDL